MGRRRAIRPKIVGVGPVREVSQQEVQQWMRTPHFATFDTLHRQPEAKEIADRLGLRSIKRNETCTQCHYTQQDQDGRVRVVAGVSCESCHGGGAGLDRRCMPITAARTSTKAIGVGRAPPTAAGGEHRAAA